MGARRVDFVAGGVVSTVGAGLFTGLAPAAELAGTWLPAALVSAAGLGLLVVLSTSDRPLATAVVPVRRLAFALGMLGRLAAAVAVAGTFGRYVTPTPELGAVGLVAVVTLVAVVAPRPPVLVVRVAAVVVLGGLALVALACFAIDPVAPAVATDSGDSGGSVLGLVASAGMLTVVFLGVAPVPRGAHVVDVHLPAPGSPQDPDGAESGRRDASAGGDDSSGGVPVGGPADDSPLELGVGRGAMRAWRLGVVAVIAVVLVSSLAVGAGVLRQLGAPRLTLSPTPLLDALAAADASALEPLVVVAVAVACGFVSLGILRGVATAVGSAVGSAVRSVPPVRVGVATGVVVAVGVLTVAPSTALVVAAVLLLGDAVLRLTAVRHRRLG